MRSELIGLRARFEAWSLRERLMVFGAALAAIVALTYAFYIEPAQRRASTLRAQIADQRSQIADITAELQALKATRASPDVRAEEIRRQISAIDESIRAVQQNLVPADRINALLHQMLRRESGVQLVSLRTLVVEPLSAQSPAVETGPASTPQESSRDGAKGQLTLYKHGVEIMVSGNYSALHDYLVRLEQAPARLFWWRAQLAVSEQTKLTLTLTLYTLSLDKAWLQV